MSNIVRRFEPKVRAVDLGGRELPKNVEAEAAVLSAMLADPRNAIPIVRELLAPTDFGSVANETACEGIYALDDKRTPVDIQTLAAWLKDQDKLVQVGGVAYLAKIVDATPSVAHVEAHAKIVREKARRRRVILEAQAIAAEGYLEQFVADDDYVADAGERMYLATAITHDRDVTSIRDIVRANVAQMQAIADGASPGFIPSGFHALDEAIVGLFPGEITVIAARPGIGKTALAGNMLVRIAATPVYGEEIGCLVFSIEMPKEGLGKRMAASEGGINGKRLRDGKLSPEEWSRFISASEKLEELPIFVHDGPQTVAKIRATIRRQQAKFNRPASEGKRARRIGVVAIDYLTLIDATASHRRATREEEVGEIAKGLKELAKETGVHLLELVQLTKDGGKGEMPGLSDIRESGQIEHCAHNVWMLHRPEKYVRDRTDMKPELKGLALVHAAKTRDGTEAFIRLHFTDWCVRFDNPWA